MLTIHFQYRSIQFLTDKESPTVSDYVSLYGEDFETCFKTFVEGDKDVVVLCSEDFLRSLLLYIKKRYIVVKAAGGVVENGNGELLLMTRNDRADLPKGKVERGETLAQAALRETCEETGLSRIELGPMLLKTYHIYDLYGGWHFKQTTWYRMRLSGWQPLVPQTEEQITDLCWLPSVQWSQRLNSSYATMRQVVRKVFENV